MPEHTDVPRSVSWKPIVGATGAGGAGVVGGLSIANASAEQAAFAGMMFALTSTAAVVGWVASMIVNRKYVHAAELVDVRETAAREVAAARLAATKREAELVEERDYLRRDVERWRDAALQSGRVAEIAVPAAVAKKAEATPP